jgi:probable HAF family extracellular repeat protein
MFRFWGALALCIFVFSAGAQESAHAQTPSFQGLGFLPGDSRSPAYTQSAASSVSADGSVVVGCSGTIINSAGWACLQAFRWTASGGMVGLGFLPGLLLAREDVVFL